MDVARETLDRGEDHEIADDPEKTVIVTLELLESRLRAIEHALYGHMDPTAANGSKDKSAATRLRALELALEHYTAKTKVIQDLLKLYAQFPDLFQNADPGEVPSLLDAGPKAAIVRAYATDYHMTASSLTSILDTPIPDAELSAKVMATRPQIAELVALQISQLKTIGAIRERGTIIQKRWLEVDILQASNYYLDVEYRFDDMERIVRRATRARKEDV